MTSAVGAGPGGGRFEAGRAAVVGVRPSAELVFFAACFGVKSGFWRLRVVASIGQQRALLRDVIFDTHRYCASSPSAIAWFIRSRPLRKPRETPESATTSSEKYDFHHEYLREREQSGQRKLFE